MYSVVTAKGQITIPVEIRKRLGITPGMYVSFSTQKLRKGNPKQQVILVKPHKNKKKEIVNNLFGSLNKNKKIKYIPLKKARNILAQKLKQNK